MNLILDDNTTRNSILQLLKKSGGLSIEELSRNIHITPMGIRQHLLSLEKKGIVTYIAKKHGIGRPGFFYMLTDAAEALFPKSYDRFALEALEFLRESEGPERLDMFFKWRKDRQLKTIRDSFASKTFEETVHGFRDLLQSEGHLVELTRNNGHYHFKQYNCPVSRISAEFRDICTYELQLYHDLFGPQVVREQNMAEGSPACIYRVPAS